MSAFVRFAALFACMLSFTAIAQVNPPITVEVDATPAHPIDPRIYGASWASAEEIDELGITVNRWGGNAMSRYNWIYSTANRCKDWYFYNIPDVVSSGDGSNGKSADDFIGMSFTAGADPLITVPLLSLLPKDREKRCSYPGNPPHEAVGDTLQCGNGRWPDANPQEGTGPRILGAPDPGNIATAYDEVHQANWIQHIVSTWGSAATGGVKYYALDNEPSLWSFDHWDVHPSGASYDEVWEKMRDYGAAIKAVEPNAILTGPEEWGWSGYFMSGLDQETWNGADRAAHDDMAYIDWLLEQARQYEETNGTRILDVVTVHYYPQGGEFWSYSVDPSMQELRNRSTRSLWDPTFEDLSWIGDTEPDSGHVKLIPRLKEWAATHNPPLEIGITEYNWGDVDHINLATTQADILGIFGREGLNLGIRWVSPPKDSFTGFAYRMYRNYDGAKSKFGDVSVPATVPNPDEVSAFAARRSSDDALTIMLIAKRLSGNTPATVNVSNFVADGTVAERWQLNASKTIVRLADVTFNGSVNLTLPPQTITLLVIPGADVQELDAPQNFTATATSTSSVSLAWTAVAGAASYAIEWSSGGGDFIPLATTALTSHAHGGRTANTSYVYRVRAVGPAGNGPFSAPDAATTVVFTDDPLVAGITPIRATHLAQLRVAVNALRVAGGLDAAAFTDASLSSAIAVKRVHVEQLRTALAAARTAIGLTAVDYTDPSLAGVNAKAIHVTELRNGVK